MKRVNPPQAYLRKSREIEKYLRPTVLAAIYALLGIAYFVLISLIFVALVYDSDLTPTPIMMTVVSVIAFVPSVLAVLAYFLRPDDPLSRYISKHVDRWRQPMAVADEQCTLKARLRTGEDVFVALSFYYPEHCKTLQVKERLRNSVSASLSRDFLSRSTLPTYREIEHALDATVELIAEDCTIPVLYLEVTSIDRMRNPNYACQQDPIGAFVGMKTMA